MIRAPYGYLLRCGLCQAEWVSESIEDCNQCGAEQVGYWRLVSESEVDQLRRAAKRVLEADMRGVRDIDALNALEDAAGFTQQGQRRKRNNG